MKDELTKFLKFCGTIDKAGHVLPDDVLYIDPGMVECVCTELRKHTRISMVSGTYWIVVDPVDVVAKRIDDGA
jgi:hypothetical protein